MRSHMTYQNGVPVARELAHMAFSLWAQRVNVRYSVDSGAKADIAGGASWARCSGPKRR